MRRESPFAKLIEMIREEGGVNNPPSILFASVLTPKPLVVQIGDLQLDADNLFVADYLLEGYERKVSEQVGEDVLTKVTFTDTVNAGDMLAVMPTQDRQTFIVLARVVRP